MNRPGRRLGRLCALSLLAGLAQVLSSGAPIGSANAAGELLLPVASPILRPSDPMAADPLCMAPPAFAGNVAHVPPGTFEALVGALLDGNNDPNPPTIEDAARLTDDLLLRSSVHLARLRGLADGLAEPDRWHIVSVRADLCSEIEPVDGCTDELRVIAQPFAPAGIYVHTPDLALHLIYDLPDAAGYLQQAQAIAAQQAADGPRPACDAAARANVDRLLADFARPQKLTSIAWLTSSASGQQWTFGRFAVGPAGLAPLPTSGGGYFDNFSKPMLLSGHCPVNSDAAAADRAAFDCPDAPAQSSILPLLNDPRALRRPDAHCVACHSRGALSVIATAHAVSDALGLPLFFPRGVDPSNLRQFGYDHLGRPSVSGRLRAIAGPNAALPTAAYAATPTQTVFSQPPSTKYVEPVE